MKDSVITLGHEYAFHIIRSPSYDDITLWSCRINGEQGVAIVMVEEGGRWVTPLFVSITSGMKIELEGEEKGDDECGPTRYNP